jgi:hypothetical protein
MIKRRNHGRGHSYYADHMPGHPDDELVKLPGVTTVLQQQPKTALIKWAATTTADYAVDYRHRLVKLPPSEHLKELYGARHKHVDPLARRGTEVHRIAGEIVQGKPVEIPAELRGHVEQYRRFLEAFKIEPVAVELIVANRALGYCGSADLVAHVYGWGVTMLEIKTSASAKIWPEAALQACGYERGEVFAFPGETDEHPLAGLGIERAGALSLRGDGYDLRPLDTGPAVWDYFCRLVANHYAQPQLDEWVGEAVEPGAA